MVISPAVSPRSLSPATSPATSSSSEMTSLRSFDLEEAKEDGLFRDPFHDHSPILDHPYIEYQKRHKQRRQRRGLFPWQRTTPADNDEVDALGIRTEKPSRRTRSRRRSEASLTTLAIGSRTRRRGLRSWIMPCSLIGNVLLFVLVLYMLANPCAFSGRRCSYERRRPTQHLPQSQEVPQPQQSQHEGLKLLAEVNGLVPEFKLETVTFGNDSRYANERMFKDKAEHQRILDQWEADVPLGRGFVAIPDDEIANLQTPFHINSDPTLNGYSIASFHQYHCLWMIMRGYGRAVFPSSAPTNSHKMLQNEAEATRHVTHCFDYLRQSVLCAGDSALEGKSPQLARMTDGWGTQHVCRSIDAQKKWIFENRLSNNRGIH